jgi:GGDEF domain-containing protein
MSSDPRRLPSLVAGLVAVAAAVVALVLHSPVAVGVAGAAGLVAGLLGWLGATLPLPPPTPRQAGAAVAGPEPVTDVTTTALAPTLATPPSSPAPPTVAVVDHREDIQTLVDPFTGLYTESYLLVALEARIAAARRRLRPISLVLLEVVDGMRQGRPTNADPRAVARALRDTLREADTAGRLTDGRYALVLEDTNENGAVWTVERLRTTLAGTRPGFTTWAGVSCYPAHGFTLTEILDGAEAALTLAREWRQDRIEVASVD